MTEATEVGDSSFGWQCNPTLHSNVRAFVVVQVATWVQAKFLQYYAGMPVNKHLHEHCFDVLKNRVESIAILMGLWE